MSFICLLSVDPFYQNYNLNGFPMEIQDDISNIRIRLLLFLINCTWIAKGHYGQYDDTPSPSLPFNVNII